jgi:D-glycero-alpha-D-manno-heptose-7-phosphate kinase
MIITKTPYRISLFGGGTDYPNWYLKNGGEVISFTIDKYLYISCRILPSFFKHKYRIVYSQIENIKKISQIKHRVVRESLKIYSDKLKNSGLEIHYNGDLPARSGMGSSSSFVVGLINLLNNYTFQKTSKNKLALQSLFLEQKVLKETVGSQDQIAASYGGFNSIVFKKNGSFNVIKILSKQSADEFCKNLFLVYTGINRTADFVAKTYVSKLNNKNKVNTKKLLQHVELCKNFLKKKKYDDIGLLLNETWSLKKSLSKIITNDKIDYIYNYGLKNGATGGKLLGAGGGGFLLFYVNKQNHSRFIKSFNNYVLIKVKISEKGSEVIFND